MLTEAVIESCSVMFLDLEMGGAHVAIDCRMSKFACRIMKIEYCRNRRFVRNLCRSSQINFTIQQKKLKKSKNFP